MKKCFKCKRTLSLDAYYVHKQMKDGHLNKCIDCTRRDAKEYRNENIERIREYDRQRGYTEKRLKVNRERSRKVRSEGRLYNTRWMERNPGKRAAHVILNNAIRDGRIKRDVCEECGAKKVEGHHEDYTKPLEVRWLCRKCHAKLHRKYLDN